MRVRAAGAVLLAGGLAGCAVPHPTAPAVAAAGTVTGTAPAPAPLDPSYDWHSLLRAPFGTPLRATPFPLHEVLLFHDAARDPGDARDCYGIEEPPPRFLGAAVDEFVLCYERDRLIRIDASVVLPPGEAPATFARACAAWLERADAAQPAAADGSCAGRDHGVAFSARLAADADETAGRVSVTLDGPEDPPGTP